MWRLHDYKLHIAVGTQTKHSFPVLLAPTEHGEKLCSILQQYIPSSLNHELKYNPGILDHVTPSITLGWFCCSVLRAGERLRGPVRRCRRTLHIDCNSLTGEFDSAEPREAV